MENSDFFINLPNNKKLHRIGFGTFCMPNDESLTNLLITAVIKYGYRHIDTASIYGNEEAVGKALKKIFESGIKREELFITTKLWLNDKNRAEDALRDSLKKLQLDYVDLYLIHWPHTQTKIDGKYVPENVPLHVLWKILENCVEKKLTTYIGLSNFNCQLIMDLLTYCRIKPFCNQIEIHPFLTQVAFVDWLHEQGIHVTAYAPLGNFKRSESENLQIIIEHPEFKKIADKYKKTVAQVLLNWSWQRNGMFLVKSSQEKRLQENMDVFTFKLAKEDIDIISGLNCDYRLFDPIYGKFDLYYPLFK